MQHTALTLAAAVLILGSSFMNGVWSHRWSGWDEQLESAAPKIALVPDTIGEWTSEAIEVDQRSMERSGARGYFSRRYTNRTSGESVVVLLICGRTGPLTAHTPLICLPGSGMEMVGSEDRRTVRRDETRAWGEFLNADFSGASEGVPVKMRLFWSWSPDGVNWQAPEHPRVALAGKPFLYKVFVHRALDQREARESGRAVPEDEPCAHFLRDFLPEVRRAVRAAVPDERTTGEV